MTFIELETFISNTGRRTLASRLVYTLADGLDQNLNGIDLDVFESVSGYTRTNIRSAASLLKESGVIDIYYYREPEGEGERTFLSENAKNRWAKQHYKLSKPVIALLNRL